MNAAVSLRPKPLSQRTVPTSSGRVIALGLAFALLLFAGMQTGRDFASSFFQNVGASQSATDAPGKSDGNTLPRDPYGDFLQSQVGRLLFSSYRSEHCRLVLFDNRTGASVEAGEVMCGQGPASLGEGVDQQRVRTLLQSFRK